MADVSLIVAFIGGLISFLSPCVLPLIPGFLAYLSGSAVDQPGARLKLFMASVFFVLGFSVVFAALGVLLNTVLERISYDVQVWLARIAGVIIILFGLYLVGLIKPAFLQREHKIRVTRKFSSTYVTAFVFGAAFAVGWTPCVSAVLGSIFALAISAPGKAFALLFSYSLGLGLPFLVVGMFTGQALKLIQRYQGFLKYFSIVIGVIMIILGILVFTLKLNLVANISFVEFFIGKGMA